MEQKALEQEDTVTYWYEGICPQTGNLLKLPRTVGAETMARWLMQQLAADPDSIREGKMYGVLLAEAPDGQIQVLKAFSGLLNGQSHLEGWVPPIAGREQVQLQEVQTLAQLEAIKQMLITLQQIPERQAHEQLSGEFSSEISALNQLHQSRKQQRQQIRQQEHLSTETLAQLDRQSQLDGLERRHLKQQRDQALQPLNQAIAQADARIQRLKQRRKAISQTLQNQLNAAYQLTNFAQESLSLEQILLGAAPTGTGDCCAPKLLHYAATIGLKPLAMAEFWWGKPSLDKVPGEFYPACTERCQPLLGFLLSGLPPQPRMRPLSILYEDAELIAVNKPAGLLSVPGRRLTTQDSVVSRLRQHGRDLKAVHRLDQATSGILLLAKDLATYRQVSQQFAQRQVSKFYEALLAGQLEKASGLIDLPLWGDPSQRPRQVVNRQLGKPSQTQFRVLSRSETTRVEFLPLTGRTHQIRVHAADSEGLATPILGDQLYGQATDRLYLHAKTLRLSHPQTGQVLHLQSETPF